MSLNKRQEKIIELLNESYDWITGKEISKLLNVSDRTIRSDIETINATYKTPLIESNIHHGYHLNAQAYYNRNPEHVEVLPQTSEERAIYIIQELLFEKHEINITNLQDKVYVSGYSIDNDIKRIRKILEPYDDLFLIRSKNFISLDGSEANKRKLYKALLAEETKGNFLNMNKLASLYKDFDLLMVKDILDETCAKYNFHIRETLLPILMMHIGIAIERIIHHNYIETDRKNPELKKSLEFKIAKEFFERVAKKIRIELVEDEMFLLALLLLGKRSSEYTADLINVEQNEVVVSQLVEELLEDIYHMFDIDLRKDVDLKVGLQMHIQSMIERQLKHMAVDNIYLQEIKKKYPLVFEMGIRLANIISDKTQIKIDENEIGFLALHLGSAYERSGENGRYRVLMIYPDDLAMSTMCMQKVQTRFSGRIDVVEHLAVFEEQKVETIRPDLILTTLPLIHSLKIPTVQISLFVNYEDESKVFQALNQLDIVKSKADFKQMMVRLIRPEFFYRDVEDQQPQDIIKMMCKDMEERGYVDETFMESVLERESMSSTSFTYGFAIPHTLDVNAITSCLSISILKQPIQWGQFRVQLVILLAVNENDKKLLRIFFDWLSSVVSDSSKFTGLLTSQDHEEFIQKILQ